MAGWGAITIIAYFEMYYTAGFTAAWWMMMLTPVGLILSLSGWVIYRFRETRALTLAQFFEARYSRRFRIFAGLLAWVSGVINFGIFPAVGARFFIRFCGLPETVPYLGISTFAFLIILLLTVSLCFVFLGGQIAVMVTDFFQGVFSNITFVVILCVVFYMMDWPTITEALKTAPEDASLINPMNTSEVDGFSVWFFIIVAFVGMYGHMAWQGTQGYNSSAKTAHEAKMSKILGTWRGLMFYLLLMITPIAVYVVMHGQNFQGLATEINTSLSNIDSNTLRTPVALSKMLPVGVVGMLCAMMLSAFISTHDTYLHSWGSILVQDVILPLRKTPISPKAHMWLLRASCLLVAILIFLFSMLFRQNQYIHMFMAVTGAIFIGGAGAVIIGGLYWKSGSTGGAWASLILGAVVAMGGMLMGQTWPSSLYPWLMDHCPWLLDAMTYVLEGVSNHVPGINWTVGPDQFPIDGQWINFLAMLTAMTGYIGVSLISRYVLRKPAYELDRLLHRGKFATTGDHAAGVTLPATGLRALFPSKEFSRTDTLIYYGSLGWGVLLFGVFAVGTAYNMAYEVSDDAWMRFWWWNTFITAALGIGVIIWFFVGGILDIRNLFHILRTLKRDPNDDGTVPD
jgi:SSS family solute:Na+ symporter